MTVDDRQSSRCGALSKSKRELSTPTHHLIMTPLRAHDDSITLLGAVVSWVCLRVLESSPWGVASGEHRDTLSCELLCGPLWSDAFT